MSAPVQRRQFLTLLGGAAAAWPLAAAAQQLSRMPRIGILTAGFEGDPEWQTRFAAFREALEKFGWTEGRNLQIDHRWGGSDPERVRAFAAELVSLVPNVILTNNTPTSLAVRAQTRSIPIVFVGAADPLSSGLVDSLARPGGNVTGFTNFEFTLGGKWLEYLKDVSPGIKRVLVVLDPSNIGHQGFLRLLEAAATVLGVQAFSAVERDAADLERAVGAFAQEPNGGVIVLPGPLANRDLIVGLSARYRLPTMYSMRPYIVSGGLMSYDTDYLDLYRRAASYVDRLLRGEKPGDLPVQNPTKYQLVINLKVAKALGLTVPLPLLAFADEVIE